MILQIQQGLAAEGFAVSISKLCRWFEVPRRTVYYRPVKAPAKVQERFAEPIKAMIEAELSFGYRTVAALLGFNQNTVQRIFQLKNWQARKRAIGHRPRIEALPSVAQTPNERWATDLCRIWGGRDGWLVLALVIDCFTRELLGWHLSEWQSDDCDGGPGASVDRTLRDAGTGAGAIFAEIGQRTGLHVP